jgi:hypothetical protein
MIFLWLCTHEVTLTRVGNLVPCGLLGTDRRFRGAYCLDIRMLLSALLRGVAVHKITHLRACSRENLKGHHEITM